MHREKKTSLIKDLTEAGFLGIDNKKLDAIAEDKGFVVKAFTLQDSQAQASTVLKYTTYKEAEQSAKLLSNKSNILYSKIYFAKDNTLIIKYTKGKEIENNIPKLVSDYKIDKKLNLNTDSKTAPAESSQKNQAEEKVQYSTEKIEAPKEAHTTVMTRQRAEQVKIIKALKDAGFNTNSLTVSYTRKDGKPGRKASDKLKAMRKAIFGESLKN